MSTRGRVQLPGDELPGRFYRDFYGDMLGAAEGDGATLAVTSEGSAVAAGEIFAAGLAAALGAVVAAGEPAAGAGDAVAACRRSGHSINSLMRRAVAGAVLSIKDT